MFNIYSLRKIINYGPLILLYYLSISEIDSHFESYFEILSFNIQLIIIYFWALKRPEILGNGHVFFAGIINDVVMGVPLGLSSLSYLVISLVATYVKNMTVNTSITTDWFTFFINSKPINRSSYIIIPSNEHNFFTIWIPRRHCFCC